MNTVHSGLPVLAALQSNPTWYHIGFKGGPSRLLIVDHKHKRSFIQVDAPDCQWGPGCTTCQERLRYALEGGAKVWAVGKSKKSWMDGDLSFLAEAYYAEVEYTPTVTIESLRMVRFPFPNPIVYLMPVDSD